MSDLLNKYNESDADNVVKARLQSEGDSSVAVNHFDVNKTYSKGFIPNLLDKKESGQSATEFNEGVMENQYTVELGKVDQRFTEYNRNNRYVDNNPNLPGVIYTARND